MSSASIKPQKALSKKPATKRAGTSTSRSEYKIKWFNIIFGLLMISGMVVSALGLRTQARRNVAAVTAQTMSVQVVLDWQGPDADGDCEEVIIYANGHFTKAACGQEASEAALLPAQMEQFVGWVSMLDAFVYHPAAQGQKLTTQLNFKGNGLRQPTLQEEQDIELFVENLIAQK